MHAATLTVSRIPRRDKQHLSDWRRGRIDRPWHRESFQQPAGAGVIGVQRRAYDRGDANQPGKNHAVAQRGRAEALIEQTLPNDLPVPNIQRMRAGFLKWKVAEIGAAAEKPGSITNSCGTEDALPIKGNAAATICVG